MEHDSTDVVKPPDPVPRAPPDENLLNISGTKPGRLHSPITRRNKDLQHATCQELLLYLLPTLGSIICRSSHAHMFMLNTVADGTMNLLRNIGVFKSKSSATPPTTIMMKTPLWQLAQEAGPFVRLAGLSGAAAVVLGAMGAHRTFPETEAKEDLRKIFDTANRFHFLHTLALVTVPLCKRPYIAGALFIAGMTLFSGTCYYHAFTGDRSFRRLTPIGGSCLILGWIAMVL